jgi:hypothetical protein
MVLVIGCGMALPLSAATTVTAEVIQAGPLNVSLADVISTQKKGYVHVLIDVWPNAAKIAEGKLSSLSSTVEAILSRSMVKKFPKAKDFKIDVVELPERDEYGAPRWELIRLKERYTATVMKKAVKLTAVKVKQGTE